MAINNNGFGFQTKNVTDTDTNTNLGNSNLTSSGERTFDVNGETLTFKDSTNEVFQINVDEVSFGSTTSNCNISVKNGATNAGEISFFEKANDGNNYVKLTVGTLASNHTVTLPDATGTVALLEADQVFTGKQNIVNREIKSSGTTVGGADGDIVYIGTGSVQAGKVYYFDGTDWTPSDADAVSTATGLLGIALATGATATVGVLVRGFGTLGATTGGSNGDVVYVDTNASRLTSTAPSGSGDVVRVAGYLYDATNNIVFFNPDGSWVEIA